MTHKNANGPLEGNQQAGGNGTGQNTFSTSEYTLSIPPLSRATLKKLSDLTAEMSDFWLDKCVSLVDTSDAEFGPAFAQLILFLTLQDFYLLEGLSDDYA